MNDLIGLRFGRLTVLELSHIVVYPSCTRPFWLCQCDCGKTTIVRSDNITRKRTRSCGCLLSEVSKKKMTDMLTKHNGCGTRLYKTWEGMKDRCRRTNNKSYRYYGGKGVEVCDEWEDFLSFRDWAWFNGYEDTLTIDRIDNDGDYSPSNCQWLSNIDNAKKSHVDNKEK